MTVTTAAAAAAIARHQLPGFADATGGGGNDGILREGQQINCRHGGRSKYYPGAITRCLPDGTYDIAYNDGDREEGVKKIMIKAGDSDSTHSAGAAGGVGLVTVPTNDATCAWWGVDERELVRQAGQRWAGIKMMRYWADELAERARKFEALSPHSPAPDGT
jgi:hypothetical protein